MPTKKAHRGFPLGVNPHLKKRVFLRGLAMKMYFTIEEEVIHPESREVVLVKGATYTQSDIAAKKVFVGFDHFKATVVYAESWEEAIAMSFAN
jgi:hypothetical protein